MPLLYHKAVSFSSEIFGVAECEIIHCVNCEISHFVRCEMKFAHIRVSEYFTFALMEASTIEETCEKEMYWFAEVKEYTTEIYANFGSLYTDNSEVEINVRRSCFFPKKTGRSYITVRGFEIAHAATTWSPPTAEQVGAITVNWAKGWIIEDNIIHDSRTCGISVGKPKGERDNFAYTNKLKAGYCCQLEVVMKASQKDWKKENIGSHMIRRNKIYDCGENGIVGHMGGAFSEFCYNEIYNIGTKHEYYGYEIAGIKLHAAIDAQIHHNHIHHCTMGTWLDWQAQGVHFHSNLYHHNTSDLWLEVTHGPFLADNNIFGSKQSLLNAGQGSAFVNNIFFGGFYTYDVLQRSTPYHFPHTTELRSCTRTYGGDERFYNNIFANTMGEETERFKLGTGFYNGSADSLEEYLRVVAGYGRGDIEFYSRERQHVSMANNYYGDGVSVYERDTTSVSTSLATNACITEEADGVYLEITLDAGFDSLSPEIITTEKLGTPRITECDFENPDGTPITVDKDMLGAPLPAVGAVAGLKAGKNKVLIWK